jgi:hypothetical protein
VTFHSVHVEAAQRVAAQADGAGVERLVHVSGIGADAASPSRYIRKRGEGELAVRAAFVEALFVRPAVMFGPDDAFLTTILKLLRRLPVYPMFGAAGPDCNRPMSKMLRRRLAGPCSEPGRLQRSSSSAAPASTLTRSFFEQGWPRALTGPNPVCRLARTRMGLQNTPESAPHAQSSGTNANRHRVIAGDPDFLNLGFRRTRSRQYCRRCCRIADERGSLIRFNG